METDQPSKNYKTKPYVLRAVRKYYTANKENISKKVMTKSFHNKIDSMLSMLENIEHNYYIKMSTLTKIASYKMWQTNNSIRVYYRDRIKKIIDTVINNNNSMEFDCLRLFEDDETYTGNYNRANP